MKNVETNCLVMVIVMVLVFIILTGVIMFRSTDDVVAEENMVTAIFEEVEEINDFCTDYLVWYFSECYDESDWEQTKLAWEALY